VNRRWRLGASCETPDSKGSIRCFVRDRGLVANTNEKRIIDAGITAANNA
jgi:hypothetical protein